MNTPEHEVKHVITGYYRTTPVTVSLRHHPEWKGRCVDLSVKYDGPYGGTIPGEAALALRDALLEVFPLEEAAPSPYRVRKTNANDWMIERDVPNKDRQVQQVGRSSNPEFAQQIADALNAQEAV